MLVRAYAFVHVDCAMLCDVMRCDAIQCAGAGLSVTFDERYGEEEEREGEGRRRHETKRRGGETKRRGTKVRSPIIG